MKSMVPVSPVKVRCAWESRDEWYPMHELHRIDELQIQYDLDKPLTNNPFEPELTWHDVTPQKVFPSPEEVYIAADNAARMRERILAALHSLTPLERRIADCAIKHAGKPLSIPAGELGITRERVRQVMGVLRRRVLGAEERPKRGHRWRER